VPNSTQINHLFMENWHNDVLDWFDTGPVGLSDPEKVLEDAQLLMGCFKYGKPRLASGELIPSFDEINLRIHFPGVFTFEPTRIDGVCLELASWMNLCLSGKHEVGGKLKIVEGTEPYFFRCDPSNHTFLVLNDRDKEWTIDPSFHRIVESAQSGYSKCGPVLIRSTDLSLFQGSGVPIRMEDDAIRYLCWGIHGAYIGEQQKGLGVKKVNPVNGEVRLLHSVQSILPV
jgi:hypothetical protein